MDLTPVFSVGQTYEGFTFTKALPISELQLVLYELKHEASGARVMHLANDDQENLFCLSFQTHPSDSTGVAHILEHTVLCGSKKYPVKDPFFSMARRSLNTFMNAMTGSDFTCYPASSQVQTDFYNLLSVYLDAVFFPELKELSFLQEGHRLEFEKPDDPTSPLVHRGVVFNEMKGSLSSPETRLWHAILKHLTPDLTYGFNSGGDPKEIPLLTYEGLKAFHHTFYHPSQCLFFFYGNFPLKSHLNFIHKHVLKKTEKLPPIPTIPLQKRFSKPVVQKEFYPLTDEDQKKKTFISFSFLTTNIKNQQDLLALSVLDSVLMETDASPLKKALLKSKLCTQADGYLDLDMSEIPYVIICQGCDPENSGTLKEILFKTLKEIVKKGIDKRQVEAALHQLEFSRLEISNDYGPFGLTLFMRSALARQHGCPPENALTLHAQFKELEKRIQDPNYLPGMIQTYFLDNPHFLELTMKPSKTLGAEEEAAEKASLKKIQENLSEAAKETLVKQAKDLKVYQEKTENQSIDCLPKISLTDVPKEAADFLVQHEQQDQLCIFHHECFTNHIVYADLVFDLPSFSLEELPYVQLLITLLPELGMGGRDYGENLDYINSYLGDFGASLHLHPQIDNPNHLRPSFELRGKALSRHVDKLFTLFKDACRSLSLTEEERIKELVLQIYTTLQNKLSRKALSFAIQLSLSQSTVTGMISEKLSGLSYYYFIRDLAQNLDERIPKLLEQLDKVNQKLFHLRMPHLVLSCDRSQYEILRQAQFFGLGQLPSKPFEDWQTVEPTYEKNSQARTISSPVAFSAWAFKTCTAFHPNAPALTLSTNLFENTFLHQKIREQGGAYGAGASYNPICGHFYFYGYRDPHIASTYAAFKKAISHISQGNFTNRDLEEAKLGVIQDADTPISPGHRASVAYSQFREGRTKAVRQEYRDQILGIDKKMVKEAIHLELERHIDQAVAVTFSNQSLIEKENEMLPEKLPILNI